MKVLTVSIAAYNVEKFLKQTLDSLCDERYIEDIEVLVIDDGSKDNTSCIAKDYENKYPNSIKYVAKENGGHGSTINKGIELATGKYFRILDGDDYVDKDGFCEYINKLKDCETDVVITDYWWVDDLHNKYPHNHKIFGELEPGKVLEYDKSMDSSLFGLSTLSIKTDLVVQADFRITEKCFYVDVEFIVWAIYLSKSYIYFNDKVYMYRCVGTGQNSINKANMLRNVAMQEKVALKLCCLYEEFKRDINLSEDKKYVILQRITMSIGATYRTYLLYDSFADSKSHLLTFDTLLKKQSNDVYAFTYSNKFIRYLRIFDFKLLKVIRSAYLSYLKMKGK